MHLRTRQRVIGLLLLLLLAAILAPLVLRTPEQVRLALDMSIPEAPRISEPEIAPVVSEGEQAATDRQIDEEQQQVAAAEPEPRVAPPVVEEEPSEAPQPAAQDAPQPGFTVQVASFSNEGNANKLKERLQAKGYKAYVKAAPTSSGKVLQRVFVGPELKKAVAEQHKAEIEAAFKLKATARHRT